MPSKKHLFRESAADNRMTITPLNSGKCPLCDGPNAAFGSGRHISEPDKVIQGWCPACTNVCITEPALNEIKTQRKAYLLSAVLRQLPDDGWQKEIGGPIKARELDALISTVRELSVLDQFDEALRLICEMCPLVGQASQFKHQEDWPSLTAKGPDTALYIIFQLAKMEYIEKDGSNPHIPPMPTWKAYQRLQEIQASGRTSQNGFVAMSFAPSQTNVWTSVIRPAITGAGYKPIRVDKYEHNNRIDDEIVAQIRKCRFLVADFTGQRNGVYFEAGFAQGLGRRVICMCHDSEKDKLCFDTRQINHIFYNDLEQARTALTNRIVALEGEGDAASS
jgi:nucleoside 2-deoxyribosyltransferase